MKLHDFGARRALPLTLLALGASGAHAQILLSGNVSDSTTGPLLSGQVYLTTNSLSVPAGETLTLQPGAILKLGPSDLVTVAGTLIAPGGTPATITSYRDDAVGGDSNGDGSSAGAPADWGGVRVMSGGNLDLTDVDVRYAGSSIYCPIYLNGGAAFLQRCVLSDSDGPGINGVGGGQVTVLDSHIANCAEFPIQSVDVVDIATFSNNTASGNGAGDVIRASTFNLGQDLALQNENLINGVLALPGTCSVDAGQRLTLGPDLAVKIMGPSTLNLSGELVVNGTASQPTVITSFEDDSWFGDSNGDGPSVAMKGDWAGIRVFSGSRLELNHAVLRAAGSSIYSPIFIEGGDIEVYDSLIEFSNSDGINFNAEDVSAIVERTDFRDLDGFAMNSVLLVTAHGFSANTASGNVGGNCIRFAGTSPDRDAQIVEDDLIRGVLLNTSSKTIPEDVTLELGAGVVLKQTSPSLIDVRGTLRLMGTESDPVVLTSYQDDEYGGDTNLDGPSSGSPANWAGVRSLAAGNVIAEHALVRYAGSSIYSAFYGDGGSFDLRYCAVENSDGSGMDLNANFAPCSVVGCRFDNNNEFAVTDARFSVLEGFDSNTASGNGSGDYIRSLSGVYSDDASLTVRNLIDGVVVVPGSLTIAEGSSLTLEQGTTLKVANSSLITVNGVLKARGTVALPVGFTSIDDDTFAGDTNGDGPSFGAPGAWAGIRAVANTSGNGILELEHARIRGGGSSVYANLVVTGAGHTLRAVHSSNSSDEGFRFDNCILSSVVNCVAEGNGTRGIELNGGAVEIYHATVAGNDVGVWSNANYIGQVRNSIVWDNNDDLQLDNDSHFNFSLASDAPAGNGNVNADPPWVDGANGDYRLQLGSPAVDVADPTVAVSVVRDALDASRLLAPAGLGGLAADLGAFEQSRWSLAMSGSQAIGETLTFTVGGEPGVAYIAYSPNLIPILLEPFGMLQIGPVELFQLALVPSGVPALATLPPSETLVGFEFGVQGVAVRASDPNQAQFTNLQRVRVEPALP
jgi:hypothetical protein